MREDDEPATLGVVGCPVHGSAAELAIRFRTTADEAALSNQLSVRSRLVTETDRNSTPTIIPVTTVGTTYAMKIAVRGSFDLKDMCYR